MTQAVSRETVCEQPARIGVRRRMGGEATINKRLFAERWIAGTTVAAIMAEFDMTRRHVYSLRHQLMLPVRQRGPAGFASRLPIDLALFRQLVDAGTSTKEIAAACGLTDRQVNNLRARMLDRDLAASEAAEHA